VFLWLFLRPFLRLFLRLFPRLSQLLASFGPGLPYIKKRANPGIGSAAEKSSKSVRCSGGQPAAWCRSDILRHAAWQAVPTGSLGSVGRRDWPGPAGA